MVLTAPCAQEELAAKEAMAKDKARLERIKLQREADDAGRREERAKACNAQDAYLREQQRDWDSNRDPCIMVSNLPVGCKSHDVRQFFHQFGR